MDLFDEIKRDLERDRLKNIWNKYAKLFSMVLSLFIVTIVLSLLYHNYKNNKIERSYISFQNNMGSEFSNNIIVNKDLNNIDLIHLASKLNYSPQEYNNTINELNNLDINRIFYMPFQEVIQIYMNQSFNVNNNSGEYEQIFINESRFIDAMKKIEKNLLQDAYEILEEVSNDIDSSIVLKNKSQEIMKIIKYRVNEASL